ncbi:hypothetical protein [Lactococcus phage Nocturne116]|nr:hypothetical protein [Lactococcus phage Nocturne116]
MSCFECGEVKEIDDEFSENDYIICVDCAEKYKNY